MRTIATDDPVTWRADLSVTRLCPAETAKRIDVLFGMDTLVGQFRSVLDGVPILPRKGEREWGVILSILHYTNTAFSTHSPGGGTFDATFAKLL